MSDKDQKKTRVYTKWGTTNAHLGISNQTWALPSPSERLEAAKADLRKAKLLTEEEINNLTDGKLNHAFKLLPDDQQATLNEQRIAAGKKGRKRAASGNVAAAAALNLPTTYSDSLINDSDLSNPGNGAGEDALEALPFTASTIIDGGVFDIGNVGTEPRLVLAHPHYGAVFVPAYKFDEKTSPCLIARVPSYGVRSSVASPVFADDSFPPTRILVPVRRENAVDLLEQVMPNSSSQAIADKKVSVESMIKQALGDHVTYAVLQNAYRAMSPVQEEWNLEFTLKPPYHFKDISEVIVLRSSTSDCIMIFPLATEGPPPVKKAAKVVELENQ